MTPEIFNLDPAQNEHVGAVTQKGCCAPAADHRKESHCCANSEAEPAAGATPDASADAARPMVALPGGTFLMGTDYAGGFPADGEGPVRPVTLSPFAIDVF